MDETTRAIVTLAFAKLVVIFPAWKQSAPGNISQWASDYKAQLLEAFFLHNINKPEMIKAGLAVASNSEGVFMPKPGQFAKWCKGSTIPYHREFNDNAKLETGRITPRSERPGRWAQLRLETGI